MSDPTHLVLDLNLQLEDALAGLDAAARTASRLIGDPREAEPEWPLMAKTLVRIDALRRETVDLLRLPDLVAAFGQARAAMDAAPDHADRLP